jgi:ankyrin repeat protein
MGVTIQEIMSAISADDVEQFKVLQARGLPLDHVERDSYALLEGKNLLGLALYAKSGEPKNVAKHIIACDKDHIFANDIFSQIAYHLDLLPHVLDHGYDPKSPQAQQLLADLIGKMTLQTPAYTARIEAATTLLEAGTTLTKLLNDNGEDGNLSCFVRSGNFRDFYDVLVDHNVNIKGLTVGGLPVIHHVMEDGAYSIGQSRSSYEAEYGTYDGTAEERSDRLGFVKLLTRWADVLVDVDAFDPDGNTAFHRVLNSPYVVKEDAEFLVKALLAVDANPSLENRQGITSSELAQSKGWTEIAELLAPPPQPSSSKRVRPR